MQAGRWLAFGAGIMYGAGRLAELREQRPAEIEAAQAALAKQMAAEAAAKAKADADFANDSILFGTDAASRQAAIACTIFELTFKKGLLWQIEKWYYDQLKVRTPNYTNL